MSETYDYIVVGAGSAGAVVAARLAADTRIRVALVEAGESDRRFPSNIKTLLPFGNVFLLSDKRYNWQYQFEGAPEVGGREINCPRGRMLGGCTVLNGAVYIRGHARDYDDWAAQGVTGWAYSDVLKAFKRQERWAGEHSQFHGTDGELDVRPLPSPNAVARAFVEAGQQAGYARNDDFNGNTQDGVGFYHVNQRRGKRLNASRAFLRGVEGQANFDILTEAHVHRIVIAQGVATGVEIEQAGQRRVIHAREEVVLSAGTMNSPQLLMLSGIGAGDELRAHGIDVVLDLPGVGKNLQDHPSIGITAQDKSRASMALNARTLPRMAFAGARYLLAQDGPFSSNAAEAGGFVRTRPGLDRPDVQLTLVVGMKGRADILPKEHGFVLHANVARPKSRGSVSLRSADSRAKPVLEHGFLKDDEDLQTLVRGLKVSRSIVSQPAFAHVMGEEITPGARYQSDAELEQAVRDHVATVYHPVGTCRMGVDSDPWAVLDDRLRVRGIRGLRVADASVMPSIVGGNTSAPAMMIGERAAEFILQERGGQAHELRSA
ncbi:GMC family oxidoreductase [Mesobacterium pallidum]|uniref:GMC family oxidoreductase n=1 Tax=Mesobacterium pallidum TaxID=2872037 RepID=UPI001EE218EE|nr:GMC family oxidoreductase N-terminal domain-containing protein [Mesobacterium pallidum]